MPRTVFPPSAIITAVSAKTRPRSWPGVNPSRRSARDRAVVRPVRSAVSRSAAAPACEITASPSAVTVSALDHAVKSFTRKVPLDMGFHLVSTPRFSQIRGTFHCLHATHHSKIVKRQGIGLRYPFHKLVRSSFAALVLLLRRSIVFLRSYPGGGDPHPRPVPPDRVPAGAGRARRTRPDPDRRPAPGRSLAGPAAAVRVGRCHRRRHHPG